MSDDKDKGPIATISRLAIILAALGFTLFTPNAFKSPRPAAPDGLVSPGKVDARLWQDPFYAVLDGAKSLKSESPVKPAGHFTLYSSLRNRQGKECSTHDPIGGTTTILGVMVPGTPYAEAVEQRIRYRYAVLSGLRRLKYIPDDPGHLDYYRWQFKDEQSGEPLSLSNILPFEKLTYKDHSVMVLWINDDSFSKHPLSMLASLVNCLGLSGNLKDTFKLLGPFSSDTLRAMATEAVQANAMKARFSSLSGLGIYNALATADYSLLLEGMEHINSRAVNEENFSETIFRPHFIDYKRTIHSDRDLTDLLVSELERRGVNMEKDHVVLISEWDTNYGRWLPQDFKRSIQDKCKSKHKPDVELRLHHFSYMRGIDGSLPGKNEEKKDGKTDAGQDAAVHLKRLEQPMGTSQYDYLRRLSQDIHRNWDQETLGSIAAIGVLGGDFFDKCLVLQALHQQFPGAVYFTTDLNAGFLHPDAIEWSRNLVVASAFDLALRQDDKKYRENKNIQGGVPPFRDSYQTSLFFATLWAFNNVKKNPLTMWPHLKKAITAPTPPGKAEMLQPLLFEIGRHSAVRLTPAADDIHPQRRCSTAKFIKNLAVGTGIPVFLILLIYSTCERARRLKEDVFNKLKRNPRATFMGLALFLVVLVLFCWFVIYNPDEEPFSLFEGISIWPTEVLRVIAALLSLSVLIRSPKKLKDNEEKIKECFGFAEIRADDGYEANCHWDVDGKGSSVNDLWMNYVKCDTDQRRRKRLRPSFIFYVLLGASIIIVFGPPNTPVRGPISLLINYAVLIMSVISFSLLTLYVFDVTRNCQHFIKCVSGKKPEWSTDSVSKYINDSDCELFMPVKEWMLIKLIAMRTDAVGKLIFYPFIVWFIMIIARNHYFDNWVFHTGLMMVFAISLFFAWSSAWLLRKAAENARSDAICRLKGSILRNFDTDKGQRGNSEIVINEINSINEGAFLPFMQHPVVQALFLPFGGIGGVFLLNLLEKMNP